MQEKGTENILAPVWFVPSPWVHMCPAEHSCLPLHVPAFGGKTLWLEIPRPVVAAFAVVFLCDLGLSYLTGDMTAQFP